MRFQSRTFLPSWRSRFRDVKDRNELSLCTAVQRRSTAHYLRLHRSCAAAPKNRGIQRRAALTTFRPILNPRFGGFITDLKHPLLRFLELPATLYRSVSTMKRGAGHFRAGPRDQAGAQRAKILAPNSHTAVINFHDHFSSVCEAFGVRSGNTPSSSNFPFVALLVRNTPPTRMRVRPPVLAQASTYVRVCMGVSAQGWS